MTDLNNTQPQITKKVDISAEKMQQYKELIFSLNEIKAAKGYEPLAFNPTEISAKLSQKAFTGASAATGQTLLQETVAPLASSSLAGGTFINSGAAYYPNYVGSGKFTAMRTNGTFVNQVCGTPSTNEISTFDGVVIPLINQTALIEGCEDVLMQTPDPAEVIRQAELLLEDEKMILSDTLAARAVTSNNNVVAINPTTLPTQGQIHVAMNRMIARIGRYTYRALKGDPRPKFYMNTFGFAALMSEQDSQGRFIGSSNQFTYSNPNRTMGQSGLAGWYGGYEVHIVPSEGAKGILGTYTVNASGVIISQTGGTSTAIIMVIPAALPILRNGQGDYVSVFTGNGANGTFADRTAFLEGEVTIGARTNMNAGLVMPTRATYYAFTSVS